MPYFVYILSNSKNTPLYVGITDKLEVRASEQKNKIFRNSLASKYNLSRLLYWEIAESTEDAILREKQLKNWKKEWKMSLIKSTNPNFKDLSVLDN
jgi:putative endonuclease